MLFGINLLLFHLLPHSHPLSPQHTNLLPEIQCYHGSNYENNDLMECDAIVLEKCTFANSIEVHHVRFEVLMEMAMCITTFTDVTSYTVA